MPISPTVDYAEGEVAEVELHDGSRILLRKTARNYDPTDLPQVFRMLRESREAGEFLTGLIYVNPMADSFIERLRLVETPLARLPESLLKPGPEALDEVMRELA